MTTQAIDPRPHTRPRLALTAMGVGLALTLLALAAPFVDRATSGLLASHIRDGYPGYSAAEVDTAVTFYLVALSVVGGLGVVGWLSSFAVARRGRIRAAQILSTVLWLGATATALFALTVTDTSGDTGLPALLGWAGVVPCVAGLVAVVALWRRR